MRVSCALIVSCLAHAGMPHSLTRPLQAALASCCPLGEKAQHASGLSSPISVLCSRGSGSLA